MWLRRFPSLGERWTSIALAAWTLFYFGLTLLYKHADPARLMTAFGIANTVTQAVLDLLIIGQLLKLPPASVGSNGNRRLLILGFLGALWADTVWGLVVNVLGVVDFRGSWIELLSNIPFCTFLASMGLFMLRVVLKKIPEYRYWIFASTLAVAYLTLHFYIANTDLSQVSMQTFIVTTIAVVCGSAVTVGGLVLFLFGTTKPAQWISSGLLIIYSVVLMLQYQHFAGTVPTGLVFEAFWVLGLLTIYAGIAEISRTRVQLRDSFDFRVENTRARFIISFVLLITVMNICWRFFFTSFVVGTNLMTQVFLSTIFIALTLVPLTLLFRTLFIKPVIGLLKGIYNSNKNHSLPYIDAELQSAATAMVNKLVEAERSRIERSAIGEVAQQVAHDIRSPLTALTMGLSSISAVAENERNMIRAAVIRITQIADELRQIGRGESLTTESEAGSSVPIAPLIETIVSEKKLLYEGQNSVQIVASLFPQGLGLFATLKPSDFKRVLSNLINNAVESIKGTGKVQVILETSQRIQIRICDNGRGIPPEVLGKLGETRITFGKEEGSGLGVLHAKQELAKVGGTLEFKSSLGNGTQATIDLPKAAAPAWFASEIVCDKRGSVIVLDDDPSIHELWQSRFCEIPEKERPKLLHFRKARNLRNWFESNRDSGNLYLFDYELRGEKETGLALAQELNHGSIVLVTSHHEKPGLIHECEKRSLKLLPKELAPYVPVTLR
jgi:signal transduction histidine kinase